MKTINIGDKIYLIQVNDGKYHKFQSAIEKQQFIKSHDKRGYELHANHAIIHMYMVVDTEGYGWNLTKQQAVTFEEALQLKKMYL